MLTAAELRASILATLRDAGPCTPEELISFFSTYVRAANRDTPSLGDALGVLSALLGQITWEPRWPPYVPGRDNPARIADGTWRLTTDGLREALGHEPAALTGPRMYLRAGLRLVAPESPAPENTQNHTPENS